MYFILYSNPTIRKIISTNINSLLKISFLNILESFLSLMIPTSVGLMINSLIYNTGQGQYIFILCYVLYQLTALFRKILDTKVYTLIYNKLATQLILNTTDFSITNARIELLKQVVAFFENDLPVLINNIITIIGSGAILYFYSYKLLLTSLIIIIPSFILNHFFFKKINSVTQNINNLYETQLTVLNQQKATEIFTYFQTLRKHNITKSNLESFNFVFLEIFVFIMIFVSVLIVCNLDNVKTGTIVASYAIILKFAYSFDFIPYMTVKLAAIKDILFRIEN